MLVLQRYVRNLQQYVDSVVLDGTGAGTITFAPAPAGDYVEIERIAYSGAGAGAIFSLYANQISAPNLREGTIAGSDRQFADESSLVRFWPNENIIVRITGGTAAAQVVVYMQGVAVQYRQVELDPPAGSKIGHGIATGPSRAPDPGGWN